MCLTVASIFCPSPPIETLPKALQTRALTDFGNWKLTQKVAQIACSDDQKGEGCLNWFWYFFLLLIILGRKLDWKRCPRIVKSKSVYGSRPIRWDVSQGTRFCMGFNRLLVPIWIQFRDRSIRRLRQWSFFMQFYHDSYLDLTVRKYFYLASLFKIFQISNLSEGYKI